MENYIRTIEFDEMWDAFYGIVKLVNADLRKSEFDKYSYSLFERALFIFDAHVAIEKTNNVSVINILLRSLLEIKIKASLYEDDAENEISNTNAEIKAELEKFFRKVETGKSFMSQALRIYFEGKKFVITANTKQDYSKAKTIKHKAQLADLAFEYELYYWLTSLFIHSHPLSLVIEQKEKYPESEIYEVLSKIIRNVDLLNSQVLGAMLRIIQYLYDDRLSDATKKEISDLSKVSFAILFKDIDIEYITDEDVELGTLTVITKYGDIVTLKRDQRKP